MSNQNREWLPGFHGKAWVGAEVVNGTGEVTIDLAHADLDGVITVDCEEAVKIGEFIIRKAEEAREAKQFNVH